MISTRPRGRKKTPGFSPGVHRDGVSREYWPRSALRHERGVQPSACLAKRMLDRGEFPLVHHPEEQPVEIGLERDKAVIALARSRARGCGFAVGDRDGFLFRFPSPFLAAIGSFRAGRRFGLGTTLAAQIPGQPHLRPRLVDRPFHPRCRPGLVDCFRIGHRVIDQQLLDKGCLALISCLCWHDCISRRVVPAHFLHRSSINNQCKLQNQEVDPGSHKKSIQSWRRDRSLLQLHRECRKATVRGAGSTISRWYGGGKNPKTRDARRKDMPRQDDGIPAAFNLCTVPISSASRHLSSVICHLPSVICHAAICHAAICHLPCCFHHPCGVRPPHFPGGFAPGTLSTASRASRSWSPR